MEQTNTSKLEKIAYYSLVATLFLAPLSFVTTSYIAIDVAKSFVISLGTIVSVVCYALVFLKDKTITAPPKAIFWTAIGLALSVTISSFLSLHIAKSFFGQGFEIGTGSFILILLGAGWSSYEAVRRNSDRAFILYKTIIISFVVLFALHILRLFFGPGFLSLYVLTTATSTILGKWYDLAIYAMTMAVISFTAITSLPMTKRMKILSYILGIISLLSAFYVNHSATWMAAVATFAILAITLYVDRANSEVASKIGRIAWVPTIITILAVLLFYKGAVIAGPIIQKTGTQNLELSLPWQMTIDVVAGAIKNYPLFGVGPNHFAQAFETYKPLGFNLTDAWATEFNTGFGLLPTFVASQGLFGALLWILLFVFFGIAVGRTARRLPADPNTRFVFLSSSLSAIFLWLVSFVYVPSHAMFFLAFVMTGISLASIVHAGVASAYVIAPQEGFRARLLMPGFMVASLILAIVWGLVYVKKTVALAYFAGGVKAISSAQNYDLADRDFHRALSIDSSDVYWQAVSENARLKATTLISTATAPSATLATNVSNTINLGITAARQAINYDPSNYYNYVSEGRIAQVASSLKMDKGYDTAVGAYSDAIRLNPQNPALYVALAQLQATMDLNQALQTVGAALQVKNNYLDAVFLLSQIQAAKGNLPDAIIAATVATQINPNSPLLYFQLGLLQYNAKNYAPAEQALAKAVQLQPDYANAKYFLGLSAARLGETDHAISLFQDLASTNPDNKDIATILGNLRSGRSVFSNTETHSSLPVKEKR